MGRGVAEQAVWTLTNTEFVKYAVAVGRSDVEVDTKLPRLTNTKWLAMPLIVRSYYLSTSRRRAARF